jgi:hypothetical protein
MTGNPLASPGPDQTINAGHAFTIPVAIGYLERSLYALDFVALISDCRCFRCLYENVNTCNEDDGLYTS